MTKIENEKIYARKGQLKTGPQIGDTDCVIYAQKWSTFYTEPIKDKIKIPVCGY